MPLQYKIEYRVDELTEPKGRKIIKNSIKRPASIVTGSGCSKHHVNVSRPKGSKPPPTARSAPSRPPRPAHGPKKPTFNSHTLSVDGLDKLVMPAGCCVHYNRGAGVPLTKVDLQPAGKTTKSGQKGLGVVDPVSNLQHKVVEEEYVIIREVVETYLEKKANGGNNRADQCHDGGQPESGRPLLEEIPVDLPPCQEPAQENMAPSEPASMSSDTTDPAAAIGTKSWQSPAAKSGRRCLMPISKAMHPHGSPSGPFLVEGQGAQVKEQPEKDKEDDAAQSDTNRTGSRFPGGPRVLDVQQDSSAGGLLTVEIIQVSRKPRIEDEDKSENSDAKNKSPVGLKTPDLVVRKCLDPVSSQAKSPKGRGTRTLSQHSASPVRDNDVNDNPLEIVSQRSRLRVRSGAYSGTTDTRGINGNPLEIVSAKTTLKVRGGIHSGTTDTLGEAGVSPAKTTIKSHDVERATKLIPAPCSSRPPPPPHPVEPNPPCPVFRLEAGRRGRGEGRERSGGGVKRGRMEHWQPIVSRQGLTSDPPDPAPITPPSALSHGTCTGNIAKLQPVEGRGYVTRMSTKVVLNVVLPRENKFRESKPCPRNIRSGGCGTSTAPQRHVQALLARASSPPPPPPPTAPSVGNWAFEDNEDDDDTEGLVTDQRPFPADNRADFVQLTGNAFGKSNGFLGNVGCYVESGDDEQQNVNQGRDGPAVNA